MAEIRKLSEANIKDEEESAIKRNIDNSDKINFDREDEKMEVENVDLNKTLQRYSLNELLSLRNAQLTLHYPHCVIRPELQVLSIWTCRLRSEMQYLGLWKVPNAGSSYGNCNCNGNCQSYACEGQPFPFQAYPGTSQMCYANVPNSLQVHPMLSSSPTMGAKKTERSRERFLNYQRNVNTELIRATSPGGEREGSLHYPNHQAKPAFIDHRSISSSHLMPAFAKRRMGHANVLHGQLDAGGHYNPGGSNAADNLSNDGAQNESSNNSESSVRLRKESAKPANDPNDYHLYKASVKGRIAKSDRTNSDYSPSGNKLSPNTSNKKLISERRIGSGRLIPREVSLEMRAGSKKRLEKEIPSATEKEPDSLSRAIDKPSNRNSSLGRYSDPQVQEMRIFDRRISSSEDSNNANNTSSRNKKYNTPNFEDDRNNFESNYQQASHFTGKRSISFRRREYVDPKDNHRDFRDFRERKDPRDGRETREQREDEHHHHHHHHFYHRDNKEEPEWFSEGPTSQHETIELRGFEETDDTQQQEDQTHSELYSKTEKLSSNSSLLSLNSSSNVNLSAKSNIDISNELSNNSDNKTISLNNELDNDSNSNENTNEDETKSIDKKEATDLKDELQQILPKADEYENLEKQRSNVTELFIDNFLNMEAIENSLLSGGNDQSTSSLNEGGGTSRFSRWFFNNSNNVNSNDEFNNNPPSKDDSKQHKDINESDFNSFMSFFKCNNYQTPELPKGLPSNVSALSVEELEARMRKIDTNESEKATSSDSGQNLHKNALSVEELEARMRKLETYEMENFGDNHHLRRHDNNQPKKFECPSKPEPSPQTEANTQDVEAFRKLLDQLGKPPVDVAMNINLQGPPGPPQPIKANVGAFPPVMPQLPPLSSNPLPQINMPKQEFMMQNMHQQQPIMHRQQNLGKMPLFQHQYPHSGMAQPQPENMPFMPVSHHPQAHHMPMMIGQPQKRLDVQHLIQSVVRGELSRSFLEKELQNRNISPYNKEVITTVLKETARFNVPDSIGGATNSEQSVAPNNLMQSLARGEVSLNFVEHELNKMNNININNDTSASAAFKERSRCATPLTSSMNVNSIPTSGNMIVPLASQVVPRQEQNSILTNETISVDQQQRHQNISSMYRSNYHDPHSQAMMQNALFKKKLEMEQHEALRRRQETFKQQKQEPDFMNQLHQQQQQQHQQQQQQQSLISNSSLSQQGHQHSSRQLNNPTPLAFMPTSVLRKMTAEKEPITSYSHATTTTSSTTQQQQQQQQPPPHLQQPHLKIPHTHPQMSYQHSNQPRIILGRGNFQYMHQQQQPQIPPAVVNDSSQFLHNKNLNYAINGHF